MTLEARDCIEQGRPVVYVDNENGPELFAERLTLVGANPETVDARFHYVPFPTDLSEPAKLRPEVDAITRELPGALIVLDSMRTFMSRFGLSPNVDVDIEQFLGPIMGAVKNAARPERPTVAVIDHSKRTTQGTDEYVAAGSAAKPAAVDAAYFFEKVEPFSRDVRGLVKVTVKDDRRGRLDFERFYRIGGQGEGQPLYFDHADASEVGTVGRILKEVREYLADNDGKPSTLTTLRNQIKGSNTEIDAAARQLARDPSSAVFEDYDRGPNLPPKYRHDQARYEEEGKERPLEF